MDLLHSKEWYFHARTIRLNIGHVSALLFIINMERKIVYDNVPMNYDFFIVGCALFNGNSSWINKLVILPEM